MHHYNNTPLGEMQLGRKLNNNNSIKNADQNKMKTENNNSKRYITNNLEKKQYLLIIMIENGTISPITRDDSENDDVTNDSDLFNVDDNPKNPNNPNNNKNIIINKINKYYSNTSKSVFNIKYFEICRTAYQMMQRLKKRCYQSEHALLNILEQKNQKFKN
ncbi:hypothetical protein H8356DRAFT_1378077 [Neocallimastix lanati (nom. inval.)]|nr:hypothetical protein H8356DRAFT_1378077 [Neocallimastix sp. JGI-2020a]